MLREVYAIGFESGILEFLVKSIFLITFTFLIYVAMNFYFSRQLAKLSKKRPSGERASKQTRIKFTQTASNYILWFMVIIYILLLIPEFRAFSISLLAGAGIAAIVVGFAAQKTLANIIAGVSIAIYTPFRIGDRLKIGEEFGDVEDINLRHTIIRTWENKRIIIPNSLISDREIINFSIKDEKLLIPLDIGISYDSDIDKARKIMLKIANKHPDVISPEIKDEYEGLVKREPVVRVTECGEYSVKLRLLFWVESNRKAWTTRFDLIEAIKKEFDKQGIEIPFPYRTIVYKKDMEDKSKRK